MRKLKVVACDGDSGVGLEFYLDKRHLLVIEYKPGELSFSGWWGEESYLGVASVGKHNPQIEQWFEKLRFANCEDKAPADSPQRLFHTVETRVLGNGAVRFEPVTADVARDAMLPENADPEPAASVAVYLDDGRVYSYNVISGAKGTEHAAAIIRTGYRHKVPGCMEHYPPHRILKVVVRGDTIVPTYNDSVRGT